jgi:redox-sensitive bicupin YhaK (pirin superfamily)
MRRRSIGPFTFLDHFGPAELAPGAGMDVRPHPHIGLATVTYHFEGLGGHKDSLGVDQVIRPGDVNWMTAGRGIVHSERTPPDARAAGQRLHGMQAWVALPVEHEETEPEFHHHPESALPAFPLGDARARLLAGTIAGHSAPVKVYSPLFYLDLRLPAGGAFNFDTEGYEAGLYLAEGVGGLETCDENIQVGELLVYRAGAKIHVRNADPKGAARAILLGGAPLPEKRSIYWNFVSSRPERIEQAKADWREGRFPPVPGDDEFIPLPPD